MQRSHVPAALAGRLGHDATDGLIDLLDSTSAVWNEQVLTRAEARFRAALAQETATVRVALAEEIAGLRVAVTRELHESLAAVRQDFGRELGAVRHEFARGLASVRVEVIRWSFLFWIGQVVVMTGLLTFMLRATGR
jgi:hypothetical protein